MSGPDGTGHESIDSKLFLKGCDLMRSNYPSLSAMAAEVERQEGKKNDLVVPDKKIKLVENQIVIPEVGSFIPTTHFHGQLAEKLQIPKTYYDRIGQIPGLREYNVNSLMENSDAKHLIRTLDGKARACLSDSFKPVDNFLMLASVFPVLQEYGSEIEIKCVCLTEYRMMLQIIFKKYEGEVKKGDVVQLAVTIVNSEIGLSYAEILSSIWRCICGNGAISESIFKKRHAGRKVGDLDDDYNIFRSDTIKAELESYRLRIRDLLAAAVTEASFKDQLAKLQRAESDKIEPAKVNQVIENVTRRFGIPQSLNEKILGNMVEEGNINRYGLLNGITALAKELDAPDAAFEMEKVGGRIIELSPKEWKVIQDEAMAA